MIAEALWQPIPDGFPRSLLAAGSFACQPVSRLARRMRSRIRALETRRPGDFLG
jgi:hypothetical protein